MNRFHNLAGFVWFIVDGLSSHACHKCLSGAVHSFDLLDNTPSFLCMSLGLGLNILESLETEIAGNDSDNTEQRQEYGRRSEPPIGKLDTVV